MENQIKNNPDYISLSEASKIAGCTPEHLNLMARQGKLRAKKLGRNWYTTDGWLNIYLEAAEKAKNSRRGIVKVRKIIDGYLGLPDNASAPAKVIIRHPAEKSDAGEIFVRAEDEEKKTERKFHWKKWKKIFASAAAAAMAVIIFLAIPILKYEASRNNDLDKTFENMDKITFFNEDQGLVKGEEAEKDITSLKSGAALASENYKIKQIRFGGFGAEASALSDENITLEIENVRGETFLTKKQDESRLLISWTTNKLAISEIEYSKNNGQDLKKIKEPGYGFNHGLVIPGLELGTAYIYKIKARDRWGNVFQTGNYAAYSGAKSVSVVELITRELEKMFGWAKRK